MKASGDMLLRKVAGEYVLVPVGAMALKVHGMICLTESGKLLWDKLQEECSEEDLVAAILEEYEIDRETAETDVRAFLGRLRELELV